MSDWKANLLDEDDRIRQLLLATRRIVVLGPKAVWFQLGIRNDGAARDLAQAGILVVQDRCLATEHQRLLR